MPKQLSVGLYMCSHSRPSTLPKSSTSRQACSSSATAPKEITQLKKLVTFSSFHTQFCADLATHADKNCEEVTVTEWRWIQKRRNLNVRPVRHRVTMELLKVKKNNLPTSGGCPGCPSWRTSSCSPCARSTPPSPPSSRSSTPWTPGRLPATGMYTSIVSIFAML